MVERNLAKVEVASSRLVSRSTSQREAVLPFFFPGIVSALHRMCAANTDTIQDRHLAGWQSGYAAACKAVYAGSIPTSASSISKTAPDVAPFLFSSLPAYLFNSSRCQRWRGTSQVFGESEQTLRWELVLMDYQLQRSNHARQALAQGD